VAFQCAASPAQTREPDSRANGKVRVTEPQVRSEDFVIGCTDGTRMKFSDPLGYARDSGTMSP